MKKYIIGGIIILIVGSFAYWFFFVRITKDKAIKMLTDGGMHSSAETLLTFDEPFLKEWAKAFKKGNETFAVAGVSYNTKGGKAV